MQLTACVPLLSCRSIDKSLAFYQDILRFVIIRSRRNANQLEWVYLNSGQSYLMLEHKPALPESASVQMSLVFYVDQLDELHRYIRARQYPVSELETTTYGLTQCELKDPDGYQLILAARRQ